MRNWIFLSIAILLWSCASSHEKLESYVGKDIQEFVADYGYPDVAFDMGDGRRDFQWAMKQTSSMAAYDISPAALTKPAEQFDPEIKGESLIPAYGGQRIAVYCSYTLITQWDEAKKTWIVADYQKPQEGC